MISLIINADDLGSGLDRDRGILEAFNNGLVTSASLLANGESFRTAVAGVKTTGLPIGVHLNLADGPPLRGEIPGLTGPCGQLPGKEKLRQYLCSEKVEHELLRNELAAQIEHIVETGLQPDHLDGHQHCQLFPCLTGMISELAREYGILAMRTTLAVEAAACDPGGALGEELSLYRQLGPTAHATMIRCGVKTADGLWGLPLLNSLNTTNLCQLLERLPQGFWELMTHPGYPCRHGQMFDGPQRQVELQALLSRQAADIISRRGIRLCTFGDLSCAS